MKANPYTPGAGFMPAHLAGRTNLINQAGVFLASIQKRYPQQSVIYYGLRGVGKTVLLNAIEEIADELGIINAHIEASEDGSTTRRLSNAMERFIHMISAKEAAKDFVRKCGVLLKSFRLTYDIEGKSVGLGVDSEVSLSTGLFDEDLTELIITIGRAALKSGDTICLFVDEIQYLTSTEISAIVTALHRCNQLRLPIMFFGAGLPKILRVVGEARSYSERLFKFEEIDALSVEDAKDAIVIPASDLGVTYENEAIDYIVDITKGYPYFIQEYCKIIWDNNNDSEIINLEHTKESETLFFKSLDNGFFAVRYNRCTKLEKTFMIAMAQCAPLPCNINNVAKKMGRGVKSISPCRGQLISKGMIYPTGHGEIDFTVPQFDAFLNRVNV